MLEFFQKLFSTDFAPHAYCLRLPGLIHLDVWSDIVIAASYALIPISLIRLVRRRRDLSFSWMFVLFGLFIFSCGTTHALGAWTLWHPIYRFDALMKAFTAVVSLPTAVLLVGIVPRALQLPSPQQLRAEIAERKRAEEQVKELNSELEDRIEQRTRELTQAHELLAESERRRLMAVEAAGVGTWFWNLVRGEVFWDQTAKTIFGLSEGDSVGLDVFYRLVHPADLDRVQRTIEEAVKAGELHGLEYRIRRADGVDRWVRSSGSTVDSGGKATLQGTLIDITEHKRMERALAQLASIVESSDDAIIGLDAQGNVTSWNGGAERTFGYDAEEVAGKSVVLLSPSGQPDEMIALLHRIQEGERIEHFETVRRRKSGELIDISLTISPILNDRGQIIGVSKIARDISKRKETDAALRNSEERFRTLAEAVPDILFVANAKGVITFLSARFFSELGLEEKGCDPNAAYAESVHPEDAGWVRELWGDCVSNQRAFQAEFRLKKKGGGYRWVVTRALPIVDDGKATAQWIGSSTDIDQLKRIEKALMQSNGELRQFAYAAAHDMQEPLRNVVNAAGMLTLRAGESLDGSSKQYLQFCIEGAERMHGMIKDLLAFTTVVEGAASTNAFAEASEVLKDVEANLALAIHENGATILRPDLPTVSVERTHLLQLFQNMIGNALKYRSPERAPVIRISASRHADEWRFEISDNGIGFSPEYKERIFGVFKRLHPRHEFAGSGIGLAICGRIVAHYGGTIWAEGRPGEGATFFFTLPAAEAQQTVDSNPEARVDALS